MITSFKFDNCFAFNKPVEMNLRADMRTKKFYTNVFALVSESKGRVYTYKPHACKHFF